jgi:hypothetical protein
VEEGIVVAVAEGMSVAGTGVAAGWQAASASRRDNHASRFTGDSFS